MQRPGGLWYSKGHRRSIVATDVDKIQPTQRSGNVLLCRMRQEFICLAIDPGLDASPDELSYAPRKLPT